MARFLFFASILSGFLAVAIGAFGAHGLKDSLQPEMRVVFETGNRYHFYHSLALLGTSILYFLSDSAVLNLNTKLLAFAGISFLAGLVLFSLSLYALAITEWRIFGAITPFGGMSFLVGWIFLGISGLKPR